LSSLSIFAASGRVRIRKDGRRRAACGHRCRGPEPDAGAWTPDLQPRRINSDGAGLLQPTRRSMQ
jgi:hypothetical protein